MEVNQSSFTIAEYCGQMDSGSISVNKSYQRSPKVWPGPARSFLIDTILSRYPIPKFILFQKTDLRARKTVKEIVDGQQRTAAIYDYFHDGFRISGNSRWAGRKFSELDEDDQQSFVSYALSCDVFVAADESEIRQVFQRINSYQVPLNKQEQRHAKYQGVFKWFVLATTVKYAQSLKAMGVMSERNFVRMADAALFTEIMYACEHGIESTSEKKLDEFYRIHDDTFDEAYYSTLIDRVFADILEMDDLHGGPLMKSYQFYSLFTAIAHVNHGPIRSFQRYFKFEKHRRRPDRGMQLFRLAEIAAALEDNNPEYENFITSSSEGSNRINQRITRFQWICSALANRPNPK